LFCVIYCSFLSLTYLLVEMLLVSDELCSCWQRVRSAVSESYPACPTRLSLLAGLIPLLPLNRENTLDNNGEAVTQSIAVADLCSTCARAVIGSHGDGAADSHVISTMLDASVIATVFTHSLDFAVHYIILQI